jgi:uncharacterized Zn-binding protein involved in type VI secretion
MSLMPHLGRVGVDAAGATVTGNLAPSVRVGGVPVVVQGAVVAPHGTGVHANATMVGHSLLVRAQGRYVCRAGDAASCGHSLSPGSLTVSVA